jgi:glucoamylase
VAEPEVFAPGWPGIPPRWTSSAKSGVGTALAASSRVWFTLSHGILNEVYYPRVDQACTRDLGFIVTDGESFFSEEKRHARSLTSQVSPGVPAYRLRNTSLDHRHRIEKRILADPRRDVVVQRVRFVPIQGSLADYHLYLLLAPHLANRGNGNTGWVGEYKGWPMLFAERDGCAVALGCSGQWLARTAGFVGSSDAWQDLNANKHLTRTYTRAENGNVALAGELDLRTGNDRFVLALGFGVTAMEAGQHALMSLRDDFDSTEIEYIKSWRAWFRSLKRSTSVTLRRRRLYSLSAAVFRTHDAKPSQGGVIASLSIPWGFSKGDDDLGGYHLVWPRDLVGAGGGFLALGALEEAARVLRYLQTTKEADGHWSQNMWLDGTPYWRGIQMDETALPILLVDLAAREGAINKREHDQFWPMVQRAAGFLARNGPVSPQDRWEEDPGYSPFTLAAEIAALLVAADFAAAVGQADAAIYLRETADAWKASIERWTYVRGTELARQHHVEGYYVRIAAPDQPDAASPIQGFVPIKKRPPSEASTEAALILSPDALALVRFGLRAADDPRIVDTLRVIDAMLKVETPSGPAWSRYNGDAYGEHPDGAAFDGTGIGRAWPLLTGERGHYELAAGRIASAERLAHSLEGFAGESGLLPEQIWDSDDVPARELFFGQATGSARPLVWAHAEYIKLSRSLQDGAVFDRPPQTVQRYLVDKAASCRVIWRFNNKLRTMPSRKTLRIETLSNAVVHWSVDGWNAVRDGRTADTTLGVYVIDLPTQLLSPGSRVDFAFYWPDADRWEGKDFFVTVDLWQ